MCLIIDDSFRFEQLPMNLLITLCARGGSKGIPGKNIRPVNGVPLIAYSIRHAQELAKKTGADIALSTDSDEIRSVTVQYGLKSDYVRPAELATDTAGKIPVLRHLLLHEEQRRGKRYDFLLDLDVTSPLRTIADLEQAMALLEQDPAALNLFSVSPARRHPAFNMVERGTDGYYHLCRHAADVIQSRQSAPPVYDMNASFYFYRRAFFDTERRSAVSERSLVYAMPHLCFDLDEPEDFDYFAYLLAHRKLPFME
ncbi:MAG: acylneuraminate cytidylyltransferase family protein [Candidatus Peribacteraceae bacterium]|nr:acylneuraminate cytidylyltransferase family protein [Candidatus Peribacteraceae bacterium]MDD5741906.1 acylneuraminate cytidylyltransferase family protein [Candidatus Peribacteraceae bacterium]